jgi:dTDP-4-dehydrorhamnose reductase
MRITVLGASGMLGHKLIQQLGKDAEVWGTLREPAERFARFRILEPHRTIGDVEAADESSLRRAFDLSQPNVVINAVGVVKQLPIAGDVITTLSLNSILPHRLAKLSEEYGYRLITISTDCVFDGVKGNYSDDDRPNADDLYGISKRLGEAQDGNALTLRTSMIGRELRTRHGLVEWFLSSDGTVRGFRNAIYSGFPTIVLASIIRDLIFDRPDLRGLYHVSSEPINKYDLLLLLKRFYGSETEVEAFDDFRIDRSLNSDRFREATGFRPEGWESMIEKMASDPTPYSEWK